MHEKYTTRGVIVSSSAYREADRIISIYTEDFGLVSAVAAGVRRSHSKLRYHAQDYSVRAFSLVRGRDLWRFVGAEELEDRVSAESRLPAEAQAAYARVLSLIRRLIRGEERNEGVFSALFDLHRLLAKGIPADDFSALETLAVFRILHALGYVRAAAATGPLVLGGKMDEALIAAARPQTRNLVAAINAGLAQSHL
jgi:DNA repair protein RecO (recombination protein O)